MNPLFHRTNLNINPKNKSGFLTSRVLAVSSVALFSSLVFMRDAHNYKSEIFLLLVATTIINLLILFKLYFLITHLEQSENGFFIYYGIRCYILFHLLPLSCLFLDFFWESTSSHELIYFLPFACFFLTGSITWGYLFRELGSKLYVIFQKGNTGMLFIPTMVMLLSLYFNTNGYYIKILRSYFLIHFLLIGIASIKIEHDILKRNHVQT